MDTIIIGSKHRYYIDSLIAGTPRGDVYRAYVYRRSGKKVGRHYYALVAHAEDTPLDVEMSDAIVEEQFHYNHQRYTSFVKNSGRRNNAIAGTLFNKGYLMVLLSIVLLALVIIKLV